MAENFLVFLEPVVDLVPVKGKTTLDLRHVLQRLFIAP
jgi:hypothetical protein